jgi:hypothetical protein
MRTITQADNSCVLERRVRIRPVKLLTTTRRPHARSRRISIHGSTRLCVGIRGQGSSHRILEIEEFSGASHHHLAQSQGQAEDLRRRQL